MSTREDGSSPRQLQASASSATPTQGELEVHKRSGDAAAASSVVSTSAISTQARPPAVASNDACSDQPCEAIACEQISMPTLSGAEVQAPSATVTAGMLADDTMMAFSNADAEAQAAAEEPFTASNPNDGEATEPPATALFAEDREAIQRLAKLSPVEYDRQRKNEAKRLGIRESTLDAEVVAARSVKRDAVVTDAFPAVLPWPEEVIGAALLSQISEAVRRFVVCEPVTADAVALWVTFTWQIDAVDVAPIAMITAPEKRCGKSQLLAFIGKLAKRPCPASNITSAALFRAVEAWRPTLLIDEADSFLRDKEDLRGVLNSGHTRDQAFVIRTTGDDHRPQQFSTWGAKAIAGIGRPADTLVDRSIPLVLRRKLPSEQVDRMRNADKLFKELAAKLARWSDDNIGRVSDADPDLPRELHDRAQDNWRPLLQIADVAGDVWPERARSAARKLSGGDAEDRSIGVELLRDIQREFARRSGAKIFKDHLLEALCADRELRWATYWSGAQLTDWRLSKLLEAFDIKSTQIRIGPDSRKGFKLEQFSEAFARYLPLAETGETSKQQRQHSDLRVSDCASRFETMPTAETDNSALDKDCFDVSRCAPDQPDGSLSSGRVDGEARL
jgi:putative DNA primase/helicase